MYIHLALVYLLVKITRNYSLLNLWSKRIIVQISVELKVIDACGSIISFWYEVLAIFFSSSVKERIDCVQSSLLKLVECQFHWWNRWYSEQFWYFLDSASASEAGNLYPVHFIRQPLVLSRAERPSCKWINFLLYNRGERPDNSVSLPSPDSPCDPSPLIVSLSAYIVMLSDVSQSSLMLLYHWISKLQILSDHVGTRLRSPDWLRIILIDCKCVPKEWFQKQSVPKGLI